MSREFSVKVIRAHTRVSSDVEVRAITEVMMSNDLVVGYSSPDMKQVRSRVFVHADV